MCEIEFDEQPDFWSVHRPKANKEHKCATCGAVIKKGEIYRRVCIGMDGSAYTEKACPLCDKDMQAFEEEHSVYLAPTFFVEELSACTQSKHPQQRWTDALAAVRLRRKEAKERAIHGLAVPTL